MSSWGGGYLHQIFYCRSTIIIIYLAIRQAQCDHHGLVALFATSADHDTHAVATSDDRDTRLTS